MKYTISVQHGPRASRGHNLRNPNAIKNQVHILPGGHFEVWVDEEPSEAYSRLFDTAVKEYNLLQKKRKKSPIKSYYRKVCRDRRLNAVYEVVVTIGNCIERVDDKTGWEIFRKFVDEWHERNPNLQLIGAYYHADERDPETGLFGAPHLHLDYIPVAYNCDRGLSTQTSQRQAFEQMGIESYGAARTAQMQWQDREREALKEICKTYGLETTSAKKERRQHLETDLYKMEQKVKSLNSLSDNILTKVSAMTQEKEELEEELDVLSACLDRLGAAGLSRAQVDEIQEKAKGKKVEVDTSSYLSLKLTAADACEAKEKLREAEARQHEADLKKQEAEAKQRESVIRLVELERRLKKADEDYETFERCFAAAIDSIRKVDPDLAEGAMAAALAEAEAAAGRYNQIEEDKIR